MKLIEKAVKPLRERFVGHENVLLMIFEIEGHNHLHVYFAHDTMLEKISGVENEAEERASEVVEVDMKMHDSTGQYFCTVVEYLPQANKYARAVTGMLHPQKRNMN